MAVASCVRSRVNGRICSACTFPAIEGQDVLNNTKELNDDRQNITQMLFVEGNHFCPSCEKTGNCQLQAVAYHLNMLDNHFPLFYPNREVDASHPDVMIDHNRCIFCTLCVRASQQKDGKNVFAISGRGINKHLIVNAQSGLLKDTDLEATDQAAHICPTGAILIKRTGYQVPIGERIYDHKQIDQVSLETEQHHNMANKIRVATTSLAGCFGCHMSFLDMDERIVAVGGSR